MSTNKSQYRVWVNKGGPVMRATTYVFSIRFSAWKSSLRTGKKPRLDWTTTNQDRKITRSIKTVTAVRSSVHHHFKIFKTDENWFQPVSTGLSNLKYVLYPTPYEDLCT